MLGLLLAGQSTETVTRTIGGSVQLADFGSSGGLQVRTRRTIGGTAQLGAFGSSGGITSDSAPSSTLLMFNSHIGFNVGLSGGFR